MRTRHVSHYIILPTALADTPIPMQRFKYTPTTYNESEETEVKGEETYYTPNQIHPKARKSVDGTKMLLGIEIDDLWGAIDEFQEAFTHQDEITILSHRETLEVMATEEWTAPEIFEEPDNTFEEPDNED